MAFPPLVNSEHVVSVSIDFPITSTQDARFQCMAYDHSHADWDGLRDHLRDIPLENIFKLSASAAASEFCELVQFGIGVYIPHCKYQGKPHSSPWCLAACHPAIVHRNQVFRLYQQNKSSEFKVKFRQFNNRCKRVLEVAKFAYATKTKESITSQKLGSRDFRRITDSVILQYFFYSTNRKCCLLHLIKQSYLLKSFLRSLLLMTVASLYLFSLLELT